MITKLQDALSTIYGNQTEMIAQRLHLHLDKTLNLITGVSDKDWYHNMELYCIYSDGVIYDSTLSPLQNLRLHLKKIQSLGVNALHILPFLESPMRDRGFDVSNYLKVNPKYGTIEDIEQIMLEAHQREIHVFMDLVFNHVSDQHEWFKKAVQGEEHYRNFFLYSKQKPKFIRKFHKESAVWAEYEVDGRPEIVNIAFPEYTGPIPHWQQQADGYWYYHTYYPNQLDLNWRNPELFIEMAEVILYWAKLGFNFRLDAIPFIGKGPYKQINTINTEAHAITAAFKCIIDEINPNCALLVETYEELDSIIEYFGKPDRISANLAYNFHLCTSLWVGLATETVDHIWEKLTKLEVIPSHAEWLNFLRNHDELSLAYLSDETLAMMQAKLRDKGADFREGCGISGRTFSLLDKNINHFLMAYFLLASLPGGMMIPYGDEIAKSNIPINEIPELEQQDTRNINRGVIQATEYELPQNIKTFELMRTLLSQRRIFRLYLLNWPRRLTAPDTVFAIEYTNGIDRLCVYVNLNREPCELTVEQADFQVTMQVNEVQVEKNRLILGSYAGVWLKG